MLRLFSRFCLLLRLLRLLLPALCLLLLRPLLLRLLSRFCLLLLLRLLSLLLRLLSGLCLLLLLLLFRRLVWFSFLLLARVRRDNRPDKQNQGSGTSRSNELHSIIVLL
jgi:hypothetical protein